MIERGLIAYVKGHPAAQAQVADRVWPGFVPQSTPRPCVTVTRISSPRVRHLRGPSGLTTTRLQLTCWGAKQSGYQSAKVTADAVRRVLDPPGGLSGVVMGGYRVQACWVDGDRDLEAPPLPGQGVPETAVVMDAIVTWEEPATDFARWGDGTTVPWFDGAGVEWGS